MQSAVYATQGCSQCVICLLHAVAASTNGSRNPRLYKCSWRKIAGILVRGLRHGAAASDCSAPSVGGAGLQVHAEASAARARTHQTESNEIEESDVVKVEELQHRAFIKSKSQMHKQSKPGPHRTLEPNAAVGQQAVNEEIIQKPRATATIINP